MNDQTHQQLVDWTFKVNINKNDNINVFATIVKIGNEMGAQ